MEDIPDIQATPAEVTTGLPKALDRVHKAVRDNQQLACLLPINSLCQMALIELQDLVLRMASNCPISRVVLWADPLILQIT
jgi:hypothetical protein